MTTPRYATKGCAAGSQVRGEASSSACAWAPASVVWFVYFYYGDVYDFNRSSYAFVRAVRVAGAPASQ